ncbi:MAG: hypothetical protein ACKO2L_05325, partial [Planctomycetaceae bacterium]
DLITTTVATMPEKTILWEWCLPKTDQKTPPLPLSLTGSQPQLEIIPWAPFNAHLAASSAANSFQIQIERSKVKQGTWKVKAARDKEQHPVGLIQLKPADTDNSKASHVLVFEWEDNPNVADFSRIARWCPLELKAGGVSVLCALQPPMKLEQFPLDQFLAIGYQDAMALDADSLGAIGLSSLENAEFGIEIHSESAQPQLFETTAGAEDIKLTPVPDGGLQRATAPKSDEPSVIVTIRCQPTRESGEAKSLQIAADLTGAIPHILLRLADKSDGKRYNQLKFFATLLQIVPGMEADSKELQQAVTDLPNFSETVDLNIDKDVKKSGISQFYRDAEKVCEQLESGPLPTLEKSLLDAKSQLNEAIDKVTKEDPQTPEKKTERTEELANLQKQLNETTAAIAATKILLKEVSAQKTWFDAKSEPHLTLLNDQLAWLRAARLRIVFFANFPDPARAPNSTRGRVRLMEVSISDTPEASR